MRQSNDTHFQKRRIAIVGGVMTRSFAKMCALCSSCFSTFKIEFACGAKKTSAPNSICACHAPNWPM
jgi:hypothetical protein